MKAPAHAALGALAGVIPDALLLTYGWRRRWLADEHWLVRAHLWLHSPAGTALAAGVAYASHLWADRRSTHRTEATRRGRFT